MTLKILLGDNSTTFIFSGLLNGLEKFKAETDGSIDPYVNDASGTIQLRDSANSANIGGALSWVYLPGSNGNYYAQSPPGLGINAGDTVKARVILQSPGGLDLDGVYDVLVEERND